MSFVYFLKLYIRYLDKKAVVYNDAKIQTRFTIREPCTCAVRKILLLTLFILFIVLIIVSKFGNINVFIY